MRPAALLAAAVMVALAAPAVAQFQFEELAKRGLPATNAGNTTAMAVGDVDGDGDLDLVAMIKVAAPSMAGQVIDWAMQLHGGGSVSDDFGLARAYASTRTLRFADGPDEVHRNAIAKLELARYADAA